MQRSYAWNPSFEVHCEVNEDILMYDYDISDPPKMYKAPSGPMIISPYFAGLVKFDDNYNGNWLGSGCGSVGRAVAFGTRGPWFDSSHQQNFIEHLFIISCIEKTNINKKRPGNIKNYNGNYTIVLW